MAGSLAIFVTGSADGIGRETARTLIRMGHRVVVHARDPQRARQVRRAIPDAEAVVVGDLTSLRETRTLAETSCHHGPFDIVIHNAGIGGGLPRRELTGDGLERIFQVNALAPYVLTALMVPPQRLVYLTSGLESQGAVDFDDLQHERGPWDGMQAYSDSKLMDVVLAFAVARRWPRVLSNAVDPGWIRTRMGGPGASDSLAQGAETQVWLATSDEPAATVTGRYLKRRRELRANPEAYDVDVQERFLAAGAALSGVSFPG
ncbi:MAG TPA: SDR family NAD(P)-dependent oxidoreductase [Candidatus Binatia bacterium]|nr:SDR family NAD(P)-dependent oxidoreductase [Candidatus Binatia bacterium]